MRIVDSLKKVPAALIVIVAAIFAVQAVAFAGIVFGWPERLPVVIATVGVNLVLLVAVGYMAVDSKKRWPGLSFRERLPRVVLPHLYRK